MPIFSSDEKIPKIKQSATILASPQIQIPEFKNKIKNNYQVMMRQTEKIREMLSKYDGVLGFTFIGSMAYGLNTDNKADIDMAVIVDPKKFNQIVNKFFEEAKQSNKDIIILGEKEQQAPYVLHDNTDDIDILFVPFAKDAYGHFTPIDIKIREFDPKQIAEPLNKVLEKSPVARTPFHALYFSKLKPVEMREILEMKKELKKWKLWRDGVSTLQLAVLVDEAHKQRMSGKQFILSEKFDEWIKKVSDPADPKRKLWAAVASRPWLVKLFKMYASGKASDILDAYKKLADGGKMYFIKIRETLPKNKRTKIDHYALALQRALRTQIYNAKVIDANTTDGYIVMAISPSKYAIDVEKIASRMDESEKQQFLSAIERQLKEGRLRKEGNLYYKIPIRNIDDAVKYAIKSVEKNENGEKIFEIVSPDKIFKK